MEELKKTTYRASLIVVKNDTLPLRPVPGTKKDRRNNKQPEIKMPDQAERVFKARKHDPL